MSKTSFVSFCIENYSDYTHKPSNEVYVNFRDEGLLGLLRDDYEDLHGMSMEYMLQFCDKYMKGRTGA